MNVELTAFEPPFAASDTTAHSLNHAVAGVNRKRMRDADTIDLGGHGTPEPRNPAWEHLSDAALYNKWRIMSNAAFTQKGYSRDEIAGILRVAYLRKLPFNRKALLNNPNTTAITLSVLAETADTHERQLILQHPRTLGIATEANIIWEALWRTMRDGDDSDDMRNCEQVPKHILERLPVNPRRD